MRAGVLRAIKYSRCRAPFLPSRPRSAEEERPEIVAVGRWVPRFDVSTGLAVEGATTRAAWTRPVRGTVRNRTTAGDGRHGRVSGRRAEGACGWLGDREDEIRRNREQSGHGEPSQSTVAGGSVVRAAAAHLHRAGRS